ncbi:hypothetical protein [Acidisoma sp. L85]|jgi:hypothetical protein|uniref:hypothetical protein n=1 Tax=Acidisoma sp. L85 TaxID=1641850 RepID=UPI00131DD0C5|nr:hypothetical protein [Acidisoma sp. L85]
MITKIEAARRQLEAAIRLVAAEEDELAVHTLTMAAYGVLTDLAKGNLTYETDLKPHATALGKKTLYDTASFLKHADRDPQGTIAAFAPEENDWRIGFCLVAYRFLEGSFTYTMAAFHHWMLIRHPDHFLLEYDEDEGLEKLYRDAIGFLREHGRSAELRGLNSLIGACKDGLLPLDANLSRRSAPPTQGSE